MDILINQLFQCMNMGSITFFRVCQFLSLVFCYFLCSYFTTLVITCNILFFVMTMNGIDLIISFLVSLLLQMLLILCPETLLNQFQQSFCGTLVFFYVHKIMISVNRDNFTSSFPIYIPFFLLLFSYSKTILNKALRMNIGVWFQILEEVLSSPPPIQ